MAARRRVAVVASIACAGIGVAAALAVIGHGRSQAPAAGGTAAPEPVTLAQALVVSRTLGPVAPGRRIQLLVSLRSQHERELQQLFQRGSAPPASAGSARYEPDARAVAPALAFLRRAGFSVTWHAGDSIAVLDAPASLVERTFRVRLRAFVTPGGRAFRAGSGRPVLPAALRRVVTGIGGFDTFAQQHVSAIHPGGLTPADVLSFYDIKPLRDAGLDGTGETVVFPELSSPADTPKLRKDLADYAAKFHLPPFNLTVRADPAWHPTAAGADGAAESLGEEALDLEIVHAIAPGARLVVYHEPTDIVSGVLAEVAMVKENPTAIISDSIGFCEALVVGHANLIPTLDAPWKQQAVQAMTHYIASGDSGAYTCGEDAPPAVDFGSAEPVNTAVGGTTVFLGADGSYFKESAWGNALAQAGGGGGISKLRIRPAYQVGPGIPGAASLNRRLVPDVAAAADENTGWDIRLGGHDNAIGGTSAAAPLWSGMTALINQHLVKDGLRRVGFANPALYWIAAHQAQFHAFHDVTIGNNLLYTASANWDAATGLGSPDAAALDTAWHAYIKQGGK